MYTIHDAFDDIRDMESRYQALMGQFERFRKILEESMSESGPAGINIIFELGGVPSSFIAEACGARFYVEWRLVDTDEYGYAGNLVISVPKMLGEEGREAMLDIRFNRLGTTNLYVQGRQISIVSESSAPLILASAIREYLKAPRFFTLGE